MDKNRICTQNDVVVNFNYIIRTALNIESTQYVATLTFKWTSKEKKSKNTMKFNFVVLKMPCLQDSDSNIIIITVQWYGESHI